MWLSARVAREASGRLRALDDEFPEGQRRAQRLALEQATRERLGDVRLAHPLFGLEVCDGARDPEHLDEGARGEAEALYGDLDQPLALGVERRDLLEVTRRELGVEPGTSGGPGCAPTLNFPRRDDPSTHLTRRLAAALSEQRRDLDRRNRDVDVDPIEQRSG
jgi:hypothetical protein